MKKRITSILNNKRIEKFIIALLALNILVFNCGIDKLFGKHYWLITIFDQFSMVIFTVEYLMRVSILSKFKEFFKPMLMMDLIAILPYYLACLPFKTLFLRIITGYGDFCPAMTFSRVIDSISIIICAGIHCLIIDLFGPTVMKMVRKAKTKEVLAN